VRLGLFEALGNGSFVCGCCAVLDESQGVLGGSGLDHGDVDAALVVALPGHDHVEDAFVDLLEGGHGDPFPVHIGHADCPERAFERDGADAQRSRGGIEGDDVVRVDVIDRHHGGNDVGLVAVSLPEVGTQRPIDETTRQDRPLGGAAFATEE